MPFFGSLCYLPGRLGGDSTSGWTAAQHARFCADLVAVNRTLPLATFTYTKSGSTVTITSYTGRQGSGLAHAPTSVIVFSTGITEFRWGQRGFPNQYDESSFDALNITVATGSTHGSSAGKAYLQIQTTGPSTQYADVVVRTTVWNAGAGSDQLTDLTTTVRLFGTLGDSANRSIGDYAGDPNKRDSETEGRFPYAEFLLREFQSQRGTAYSKEQGTLVDVENLALARFFSACGPRLAEKLRKNALPGTSDERLPYWEKVLAVPKKPGEPKWRTRQKLAAHYMGSGGATNESVRAALTALLGEVFVDISWSQGASLSVPPTQTFWPTINPGDPSLSLGGGAWTSERNVLVVTVQRPTNMALGDFFSLVDVDLFQMLDQMLPAWAGFAYSIQADTSGFILDESLLDFTAFD